MSGPRASELFIGLMSGTSVDAIDAALVRIDAGRVELLHQVSGAIPGALRESILRIARAEQDTLDRVARADRELARAFAETVVELLAGSAFSAADIAAIGSHGQTVRHHPHADPQRRYTVQIGDPATIAERTGITTVADFRRRDIAACGEGAPLAPLFHAAQFGRAGRRRAIVNIGGIANATLLHGLAVEGGFDCGPGNTLLDGWVSAHRGEPFDRDGAWAAEHEVDARLLERLLADDYFARRGPRSTGPERFNRPWLDALRAGGEPPGVVQATLAQFTATAIARSLEGANIEAIFVGGGGARNTDLMRRLHVQADARGIRLGTSDELGLAAEWVEACAFAWLAWRALTGLPGNAPSVTGATGPRVLGAIYPAGPLSQSC